MAYEMVMPYHLHMPSYFLETFTEYPFFCYEKNVRVTLRQKRYINEIFPIRVRADTPRTIPDLEERGVGPPMDKCISYLC